MLDKNLLNKLADSIKSGDTLKDIKDNISIIFKNRLNNNEYNDIKEFRNMISLCLSYKYSDDGEIYFSDLKIDRDYFKNIIYSDSTSLSDRIDVIELILDNLYIFSDNISVNTNEYKNIDKLIIPLFEYIFRQIYNNISKEDINDIIYNGEDIIDITYILFKFRSYINEHNSNRDISNHLIKYIFSLSDSIDDKMFDESLLKLFDKKYVLSNIKELINNNSEKDIINILVKQYPIYRIIELDSDIKKSIEKYIMDSEVGYNILHNIIKTYIVDIEDIINMNDSLLKSLFILTKQRTMYSDEILKYIIKRYDDPFASILAIENNIDNIEQYSDGIINFMKWYKNVYQNFLDKDGNSKDIFELTKSIKNDDLDFTYYDNIYIPYILQLKNINKVVDLVKQKNVEIDR